jgi:hypothetical protein
VFAAAQRLKSQGKLSVENLAADEKDALMGIVRSVRLAQKTRVVMPRPVDPINKGKSKILDFGAGRPAIRPANVVPYDKNHINDAPDLMGHDKLKDSYDAVVAVNSTTSCGTLNEVLKIDAPVKHIIVPNLEKQAKEGVLDVIDGGACGQHYRHKVLQVTSDHTVPEVECSNLAAEGLVVADIGNYRHGLAIEPIGGPEVLATNNNESVPDCSRSITQASMSIGAVRSGVIVPKIDGESYCVITDKDEGEPFVVVKPRGKKGVKKRLKVDRPRRFPAAKLHLERTDSQYYILGATVNDVSIPITRQHLQLVKESITDPLSAAGVFDLPVSVRPFEFDKNVKTDGVVHYPAGDLYYGRKYKFRDSLDFDVRLSEYYERCHSISKVYHLKELVPNFAGNPMLKVKMKFTARNTLEVVGLEEREDKMFSDKIDDILEMIRFSIERK